MKLIFEKTHKGHQSANLSELDVPAKDISSLVPAGMERTEVDLPEIAEVDVVRHYTNLSRRNFGVDLGFYPLGSCTMKYNPKVNEEMAKLSGFVELHPYAFEETSQGALQLLYELERYLSEITGMAQFTLQPAAGAHGELAGVMIMKAYFDKLGQKRNKLLIPDAAHGTNPASAALSGYVCVTIPSDSDGGVDLEKLAENMDENTVGIMLTNPNTLGLFDKNILKITEIVHKKGGLCYYDGANLNAIMGIARPGDMGFDIIHLNLHKSFSTPHGGGGPGSGPVGVRADLVKFLPVPRIEKKGDNYTLNRDFPDSIGQVRAFYGNFGVMVKAYTYIRALGPDGLRRASQNAVLNANYVRVKLQEHYNLPYKRVCMHECVLNDEIQNKYGVQTTDIAKRLIDFGYHPPTIYFPLIVSGALMIEPNETESKTTLDEFIKAMIAIAEEAKTEPQKLRDAPLTTVVGRLDDVLAAREPDLQYIPDHSRKEKRDA